MELEQLTKLLPIAPPFELVRIEKDAQKQQVQLYLQGCKEQVPSPPHTIYGYYERSWEHLKLFECRNFINCQLPIYRDKNTRSFTKATISFA